jgi:hypothetical protein
MKKNQILLNLKSYHEDKNGEFIIKFVGYSNTLDRVGERLLIPNESFLKFDKDNPLIVSAEHYGKDGNPTGEIETYEPGYVRNIEIIGSNHILGDRKVVMEAVITDDKEKELIRDGKHNGASLGIAINPNNIFVNYKQALDMVESGEALDRKDNTGLPATETNIYVDPIIKDVSLVSVPANPDAEGLEILEDDTIETDKFKFKINNKYQTENKTVFAIKSLARKNDSIFYHIETKDGEHGYVSETRLENLKSVNIVDKVESTESLENNKAKRPGPKSKAQTPAKSEERIKGSDKNKKGSAGTDSKQKIELSDTQTKALQNKVKEHNEKNPSKKVSLRQLKKVWIRGAGAFSSSHRPDQSRSSWAMARVNTFLDMKAGKKVKDSYRKADGDLLNLKSFEEERDEVFKKYHDLVNMGKAELENWEDNPKSELASLDKKPIQRNKKLLGKKKEEWTENDLTEANRVISYISRARAMGKGRVTKKTEPYGRNQIAMMNWAYDMRKSLDSVKSSLTINKTLCFRIRLKPKFKPFKIK